MKLYKLSDSLLAKKIRSLHKEHRDTFSDWRVQAEEDYNFLAGHQWDEADMSKLEEQGRPIITFNRCNTVVAAVLGMEANQRQEAKYNPRENDDTGLADAIDQIADWCYDYGEMEYEDCEAFEDLVTIGMGWSETSMSYDEDLDGKILREYIPALDMSWDIHARKKNLEDSQWRCRARRMDLETIKERWEKAKKLNIVDIQTDDEDEPDKIHYNDPENRYEGEGGDYDKPKKPVVLQFQWYECNPVYRAQDPQSGKLLELTPEEFKRNQATIEATGANYIKQEKRKYYQAFVVGDTLLEKEESGCQSGFTFKCMTGKRDKINREWFGIVRLMKDPQRWANRFFSQIIDIIDSNAKGGVIAERGAVSDAREFEETWARADSITWVNNGAIANKQIMNRPVAQYPQGLDRLMQFAIAGIYEVTGINLEMLGMVDRTQAGVVEESRKKSGYTILASFFDSFRQYRKSCGITLLEYIKNYVPKHRLEEVLEAELKRYADQIKKIDLSQIDVTVTESAQSDNNKMMTWAFISQIVPSLLQFGIPVPPEILEYSPLPATLTEKWKDMIERKSQPSPEQQKQMQIMMLEKMKEIEKTVSETQKNMALAQKALADAGLSGAKTGHEQVSAEQKVIETITGKNTFGQ